MTEPAEIVRLLESAGLSRAAQNEPMSRHTSWKVGGPADYFAVVESEAQLVSAIGIARDAEVPWLILGGGYNVLVADDGIEGLVLLNRIRGLHVETVPSGHELVCGAGVFFARAAQYSARLGYTGMEWGISIPGTVGGGVVNNAGAHWSDVGSALVSATLIDASGESHTMSASDLAYRYRQSALKTRHAARSRVAVTGCRFTVRPDDPSAALKRIEQLRAHRVQTQPVKEASAGSTFKNPPDGHAGALIEQAGLKGKQVGGAQIAPKHANFILNVHGASADDILRLVALAQATVRARFGVRLEPEIQFVGRWPHTVLESVLGDAA